MCPSIAKMNRGEHVSMDIMLKICAALNCDVGDIVEFLKDDTVSQGKESAQ